MRHLVVGADQRGEADAARQQRLHRLASGRFVEQARRAQPRIGLDAGFVQGVEVGLQALLRVAVAGRPFDHRDVAVAVHRDEVLHQRLEAAVVVEQHGRPAGQLVADAQAVARREARQESRMPLLSR